MGPGRERGDHAVAHVDRIPAFGHGRREAAPASFLEPRARHPTFALTILGTFLTRSGVVNSVHSFILSAIGPLLLGYLVAILVLSVGLLLWRSARLRDAGPIGAPLSREAIFLFQNVLFMAATLT